MKLILKRRRGRKELSTGWPSLDDEQAPRCLIYRCTLIDLSLTHSAPKSKCCLSRERVGRPDAVCRTGLAAEVTWVGHKACLGTEYVDYTVHMGPAKHQGSGHCNFRQVCLSI